MALIVQKYGGTSVGKPDRIKSVARRVAGYVARGHKMVIVVSAMKIGRASCRERVSVVV